VKKKVVLFGLEDLKTSCGAAGGDESHARNTRQTVTLTRE
jgi:hypothetical protein